MPSTSTTSRKVDFTLTSQILGLTIPVALTRQLDNLVGMADIFMVGKLGPEAISAVGIARTITGVVFVTVIAVTTGTFTLVAQAIGAKDMKSASSTAKQSFVLLFFISLLLSGLGITVLPFLLRALSLPPDVIALCTVYLNIFFLGSPFMVLGFAITTCLQAAGDTRTPFYISLISSIVKVTMGYLLIFGIWGLPEMGVAGAATGGIIGRSVSMVIGFSLLYSGKLAVRLVPGTSYRPEAKLTWRIFRIGIPAAFQGLLRNGSSVAYIKLVAMTTASTAAIAAYSIGSQLERVLHTITLAFGTAATTLVGQSLGAGKIDEADSRGWTTLVLSVIAVSAIGFPFLFFTHTLMGIFTQNSNVIRIGTLFLIMMVLSEPFLCVAQVSGGSLRGAGDTMPPLYYTLIAQWIIRLPGAYILAFTLGYDIEGIWYSLVVFSAIQGFLTVRKFAQGHWKTRRV
jgi:putative MATE family efflux protein